MINKYLLKLFVFYLLCILPCTLITNIYNAYSLDRDEKVEGTIVSLTENKKRIVIDKGLENGVIEGDVAKGYIDDKYICWAVAVVVREDLSEWAMDKTTNLEYVGENVVISLHSIYDLKNRPKVSNLYILRKESILNKMIDKAKEKYLKVEQEKANKEQKLLNEKYNLKKYKTFELPDMSFGLSISPISIRSPNNEQTISYGVDAKNLNREKYVFDGSYKYSTLSYTINAARDKYSTSSTTSTNTFDVKNKWGNLDYSSLYQFKRQQTGTYYPIKSQWSIGPVGIKYRFRPTTKVTELSMALVPLLEFYTADSKEYVDSVNYNIVEVKDNYIRFAYNLNLKMDLVEHLKLEDVLFYKPYYDVGKISPDFSNVDFSNKLTLKYEIYPDVSISYVSNLYWDIRKRKNLKEASTEWENGFYVFYTFNVQKGKM
ncbi:MAG: hypothetical protein HQK51_03955 [Oligoflexia bacterium]|nr:hypothetical protein [Oligoflexia bacterium]